LWSSVKQDHSATFEWLGWSAVCVPIQKDPIEVTYWRRLFAYLLCQNSIPRQSMKFAEKMCQQTMKHHLKRSLKWYKGESEDRMDGIDEWNVKRARMFCLFVLNFQWSIYFLRKTKAETSCLWIEDSSQIMRWRKGIVHQKSIPPKTINQSMGWKMCQWSKTKYEKIIEMIQRKCER